ncbi:10272_t:CDS:2 [Diversispora eburnea]|uniref:10272_t:CDS:1 n=1 Tax=Diversispora eburnea TaxID=1213867 RepID=A0A9N8VVG1_9GLOM|nr:10272_t:CDS:2 [Diversispora eburnea]
MIQRNVAKTEELITNQNEVVATILHSCHVNNLTEEEDPHQRARNAKPNQLTDERKQTAPRTTKPIY